VREAGICSSHAQFWTGQISSVLIQSIADVDLRFYACFGFTSYVYSHWWKRGRYFTHKEAEKVKKEKSLRLVVT
jgi:hypothetical protein